MGRYCDRNCILPRRTSTTLALQRTPFPDNPFPFLSLPLEIREEVFEQFLLDENADPDAWPWSPQSTAPASRHCDLSLRPDLMRPPALARVNRQLRASFLAYLYRRTTFRVDVQPLPNPPTYENCTLQRRRETGMSWLCLLHPNGTECGIRRLQLRLPHFDSDGRKATLSLTYLLKPARWQIDLIVDAGFAPTSSAQMGMIGPAGSRDLAQRNIETFEEFVVKRTRDQGAEIQGLDWHTVTDLIEMVRYWYGRHMRRAQYLDISKTVIVPPGRLWGGRMRPMQGETRPEPAPLPTARELCLLWMS